MNRFGYCCINIELDREGVRTSRTMRKATFEKRGLEYCSELALANVQDLEKVITWNNLRGHKIFRVTSNLFPWASHYELERLPDFEKIAVILARCGELANSYGQRLSFHPGPFNCLASPKESVIENAIKDLSIHGKIMDLMGMPNDHWAKINIHVGASYGDRETALETWCKNFSKLPDNVKSRLTLENDDRANLYSTKMLYDGVYKRLGVPIVFDSHHFELGPQDQSYSEAFLTARSTWPSHIRQMCHHSNSRKKWEDETCKSWAAHSDYYHTPFDSCGESVDVALESKCKELAMADYISQFV